jgi:ribosomal protein S18 acetylase RimI-like enzyme
MQIKVAERVDLPRILAIQKQVYLSEAALYDDYSLPPLRQSLEEMVAEFQLKTFLKAEVRGALVGSVRATLVANSCLIERLIVDPQCQGRGIGSALLDHAESLFPSVNRLELFTGSRSAANIRLYERHGYVRFREQVLSSAVTLVYMQKFRGTANEGRLR